MSQEDPAKVVENVIDVFNKKPIMAKVQVIAMAERYLTEVYTVEREILTAMYKGGKGCTVVAVVGDIAVVEVVIKPPFNDVPFTFSLKKNGTWKSFSSYYTSIDHTLLGAIGCKYDGLNSQFERFAIKMLGLPEG